MRRVITFFLLLTVLPLHAQDTKENAEFKLAVNLYNSGMYDLAVDQFQNFINAYPGTANSIEAKFYLGLTQMKLQRYEDARMTFQNFALAHPENPRAAEAWMRVGDAYAALKNDREAASAYERVKIFHPKSPLAAEALLKAARFYRASTANENARKALRTIIQEYPTSNSIHAARLSLGELFIEDGRPELAQAEFSRVMESSADQQLKAKAMVATAKLLLALGRVSDAEVLLKRVTTAYKATPSHPEAAYELGRILQHENNHADAIVHFRIAAADSNAGTPLREQAFLEIGNSSAAMNNLAGALKQYDEFFTTFPQSNLTAQALFNAGRFALKAKQFQTAIKYFERILQQDNAQPYRRKALVHGADAAVELKDYAKAVQWYSRYLDTYTADPFLPDIVMSIAGIYERHLNDYRRAIGYYEDIPIKFPHSPFIDDALFAIGRCRESLGEIESAVATYEELAEQYPSSEHAPPAKQRAEFLRVHKLKNRDAGLEKLALLMGDMVGGTSKADLAFKLGEIYFHDLRDYRSAGQQFGIALNAGLNDDRARDALFYRARSYHLLSELDTAAVTQATAQYETFLKQYPSGRWSDDAALYNLQLKSREASQDEVVARSQDFLKQRPTSLRRPDVLMILAAAQEVAHPHDALTTYGRIIKEFTASPLAEKALLRLGSLLNRLGLADSSAQMFNSLAAKFPRGTHRAEALWLVANIRMDQQKPNEAIPALQKLTTEHFYTSFARRAEAVLGEASLQAGQYDETLKIFASIASRDDSTPFFHETNYQTLYKLATVYNRKGDTKKAVELYRAYLQHDRRSPLAADAYFALGVIARNEGKTESASAYFRQASAISGDRASNREIAELLFSTEQYADAEKHFSQLAQSTTSGPEKEYFTSRVILCKLRRNDLKNAEPMMRDFAKTSKKNVALLAELEYEKGLSYYRQQDYPAATTTFTAVADDYEETRFASWAEFYRGKILEVTNKIPEAVKQYESILKQHPKSDVIPRVHLSLGNILYNAEKYQDAVNQYQKILEMSDAATDILPYAMNNLIETYEALQLYDAALQTTRNFIERYPDDPSVMDKRINIGVLYIRLGYHDQAIVHLQNLLDEAGSNLEAEIRYAIGEAYYYKGDYQQAILEFLKVPYLVTQQGTIDWTATALYMAGQAYEKMSKFDLAIAMYQQIIDRPGIDGTFKAAAKKEIDRVKTITKGSR